jgi:hypothetical protein
MLRDVLILLSCGSVAYAWLCAVTAPLLRAGRSLFQDATRGAFAAFGLALAALLLWSAIVAGGIVLAMMLEPRFGLALVRSRLLLPGLGLGAVAWALQFGISTRVPRFGRDFEAATALAIVAIVDDTPQTLARAHAMYGTHAIGGYQSASGGSGAVFAS